MKSKYDLSDEELVNEFMKASADAGRSNSHLVIDIMAGHHLADAHYLKCCLMARLARVKPDIAPQTKVIPQHSETAGCGLDGYSFVVPTLQQKEYQVRRVWYFRQTWYLELRDQQKEEGGTALYLADYFTVVPVEVPAQ